MDLKQSVSHTFSAAAERYANSGVHSGGPELDLMLEQAALAGSERVLDLGCGPGHTALAFAARGCDVVGVDLSDAMLAQARRLAGERGLERARFERADVESLPFPDASFDRVTSRFSAHHYADPRKALREAARVLRPQGLLLLADSVAPEDPAGDTFMNAFELVRDPSHVRNYSASQWLAMAAAEGIEAVCAARWQLSLDFDAWLERIGASPLAGQALRAMFRAAPSEIRSTFGMQSGDEPCFELPIAFFRGATVA